MLQQVEAKIRLEQKNKEAARLHLLAMQALLARSPILPRHPYK
jgi:hypothetical protein